MLKKALILSLALSILFLAVPALAETTLYSGKVEYRDTLTVTAPFGGNLEDYSLRTGNTVTVGETLFTLSTNKVYAPFNGIVHGLRALPGDDSTQVTDRYGALLYLEPEAKYLLNTSTAGAYDSDTLHNANRYLTPGLIVYLKSVKDDVRTGTGEITKVDGRDFTVEVQTGNLDPEETVTVYRDASMSTSGRLARNARLQNAALTAITAEGSVLNCAVTEGQSVKRGDLLLETVSGTLDSLHSSGNSVQSLVDGVVLSIPKSAGDTVSKNDALATLYATDSLRVTFQADESDLGKLSVGQQANVTFDALPSRAALTGTVETISSLPVSDTGSPQYTVSLNLSDTTDLRDGMSVTVSFS